MATQDGRAESDLWIPDSGPCLHSAVAKLTLPYFVLGPLLLLLGNREVGEGPPPHPEDILGWEEGRWKGDVPGPSLPGSGGLLVSREFWPVRAWGGGLGAVSFCSVVGFFVFQDGIYTEKEPGAGPGLPTCCLGAARWLSPAPSPGLLPGLPFGALVTLDSGHSDAGSSLRWFSRTLDKSPKPSSFH